MTLENYRAWLKQHLAQATAHYEQVTRLAEDAAESGAPSLGSDEDDDEDEIDYYEQSHQMFGYIAALEKCLRELDGPRPSTDLDPNTLA